jgi:hypothetical protein
VWERDDIAGPQSAATVQRRGALQAGVPSGSRSGARLRQSMKKPIANSVAMSDTAKPNSSIAYEVISARAPVRGVKNAWMNRLWLAWKIAHGHTLSDFNRTQLSRYWLQRGAGKLTQPEAVVFETGSNRWRHHAAWPKSKDFKARTHSVFHTTQYPSAIVVDVAVDEAAQVSGH